MSETAVATRVLQALQAAVDAGINVKETLEGMKAKGEITDYEIDHRAWPMQIRVSAMSPARYALASIMVGSNVEITPT